MHIQQSQDTGRVQGVVVLATLVLLARDKAKGGRWLESRKKEGRGREKTGREEKTARPACAGKQKDCHEFEVSGSVVECLSSKPKALGSIFSTINKQTNKQTGNKS